MCENCFNKEIESFPSEEAWLEFDLELTKKLVSQKMKHAEFNHDGKRDKDDGEYFYECNSCHQKWKLRDTDYAMRGYFLKVK